MALHPRQLESTEQSMLYDQNCEFIVRCLPVGFIFIGINLFFVCMFHKDGKEGNHGLILGNPA